MQQRRHIAGRLRTLTSIKTSVSMSTIIDSAAANVYLLPVFFFAGFFREASKVSSCAKMRLRLALRAR
jgi:hypothetical protein